MDEMQTNSPARFDNVTVQRAIITDEGYLRADAVVTRTGVFKYLNHDGTIRRELRHPIDVFNPASLDSIKMRPITNGHPVERLVNAANAKNLAIGYTGESVKVDNNFIISSLLVTDTDGVSEIKSGKKRELSLGYTVDLIKEDGEFEGERYDYRQTNIRYNHLAIVDRGRAGPAAKIHLDAQDAFQMVSIDTDYTINLQKEINMSDEKMTNIALDGIEYKASLEVANAYKKSNATVSELQTKLDAMQKELDLANAAKDSLKEKLDAAESVDIESQIKSAVAARVALLNTASKLASDINMDDMSTVEIKSAVIKANCPNVNLDDKSEVYIDARFDALVEDFEHKPKSSIAKQRETIAVKSDNNDVAVSADRARQNLIQRYKDAYKQDLKGAK